jgi:hypothetical protein
MISKVLYASVAALLVSGCAAESYAETYMTNFASATASGSSSASPGLVEADTETATVAEGDNALAQASALSSAAGEDWWGEGYAGSLSESSTLIADGGIYVGANTDDFAESYGDWEANAYSDAEASGVVTIFKKYWEPEPHPEPEPHCDGWWCDHEEEGEGRRMLKESHVETYMTNFASATASGSSSASPGLVEADTETTTFAEGDNALAQASALSSAAGEDWWGEGYAGSHSDSATLIADGGILVGANTDDFAESYGDWEANAYSDADASGAVLYHKYTKHEPEPHPEPEPHCDGWWCEDGSK